MQVSDQGRLVDAVTSASRALVAISARSLEGIGEEVTLTQYRALIVLASRGPLPLAEFARYLSVTPATASRTADRLVTSGLIARWIPTDDRRQVRLELSELGRTLVSNVTFRRRAAIAEVLAAIPPDLLHPLAEALERFAAAAGEVPEHEWSLGWEIDQANASTPPPSPRNNEEDQPR
jgi:DNA-binding MarR family transcriptional regulator